MNYYEALEKTMGEISPSVVGWIKKFIGQTPNQAVSVSKENPLPTSPNIERTAFGETTVAELEPAIQVQFPYTINPAILKTLNNGGTTIVENSMAKLSTGAAANQSAEINTIENIQYHPGQGTLNRETVVFSSGVTGSEQVAGIGNTEDGFFFGYNGSSFGALHRRGGEVEIQELTITVASSTAENITVTLDGDTASVPVTNSADIYVTAQEIADFDYSGIGAGWEAHAEGDGTLKFISFDSAVHNGVYSITASTAAGTFARLIAGVAADDTWIPQTDWNQDKGDGNGQLPVMDWTKGNVFEIRYQWLGFGPAYFYVEKRSTGEYILVHILEYANANIVPSVNNPTLPLCLGVKNTTNDTDIVMYSSSIAAFTEGMIKNTHFHRGFDVQYAGITSTETPIFTLHNKDVFHGRRNRIRVKLILFIANAESNKSSVMRVRKDSKLQGASYADIDSAVSVMEADVSANIVTNGSRQLGVGFGRSAQAALDLDGKSYFLDPGDKLTVTQQAGTGGATVDGSVSVNWEELH